MNKYNIGDLVEAIKGDTVVRGRIQDHGQGPFIDTADPWILAFENDGYQVTVIEKAAPKNVLPSEPGIYHDRDSRPWHLYVEEFEEAGLTWNLLNDDSLYYAVEDEADRHLLISEYAPFARLEPVAITANKVLDEVRGIFGLNSLARDEVERIAARYGVSS